jgi:hypothetical protein
MFRARPVPWLLLPFAALAVPFAPTRLGPHASASGWSKAFAVHVASAFFGAALIVFAWVDPSDLGQEGVYRFAEMTWSERLRFPAALVISWAYRCTTRNPGSGAGTVLVVGLILFHAAHWIAAFLLMPFLAAGERMRLLYGRSVRLALWSTSCLIPMGFVHVASQRLAYLLYRTPIEVDLEAVGLFATGLTVMWWVGVILRGGRRYCGPADGPGWRPREPRCVDCGYMLTRQPRDGRCPECGVEVAASLPEARRLPSWATARSCRARVRGYLSTAKTVLRDRAFFRSVPVHSGREAAVRFMACTAALAGITVAAGVGMLSVDQIHSRNAVMFPLVLLIVAVFSRLSFMLLVALGALRGAWVRGIGLQAASVTVCYTSVVFLPGLVLLGAAVWWADLALSNRWVPQYALARLTNVRVLAFYVLTAGPPAAAFIWAFLRLRRALLDVRFAAR